MTESTLRGRTLHLEDLTGATFRDCDLTGVRIVDSVLHDVSLSGDLSNLVVNDVDVTAFVEGELDRRHPERVLAREATTPDGLRAAWAAIQPLWAATMARVEQLPEELRQRRFGDEWSVAETLRHLVFATDAWTRPVLDAEAPWWEHGLPAGGYPPADAAAIGIDIGARPTWAEIVPVRAERMATVSRLLDGLTEAEAERLCARPPAPLYPQEERSVGRCLRVIVREEAEHHRYVVRDLAGLTTGG